MARRIGRTAAAPRFLGSAHPTFAEALDRLSPERGHSGGTAADYAAAIAAAVEPLNVAGLCNPAKRNWYGVDLEESAREAVKLGVTPDDVRAADSGRIPRHLSTADPTVNA